MTKRVRVYDVVSKGFVRSAFRDDAELKLEEQLNDFLVVQAHEIVPDGYRVEYTNVHDNSRLCVKEDKEGQ